LIPAQSRNRQKRFELINLLESQQLNVATIVSPSAEVSTYQVSIGRGTFVDSFCVVSPMDKIGNYTNIYSHANIGENTVIGNHCVLQRHVQLAGSVTLGDRVYMGFYSLANRHYMHIADDTFVHPSMTVMRDTVPGEVISLAGRDLRKIYNRVIEQ
jgi:UDP-3-O-[3-hydroxymyristoyl] glucosamine N-acyltransferase